MTAPCHDKSGLGRRQDLPSIREIHRQVKHLPHVEELCNALPHIVLILNRDRQIVFANDKLLDLTGLAIVGDYLGLRPGELFQCINADSGPSGCGTSNNCRLCGALQAIVESQRENRSTTRELRLTVRINGDLSAFDFEISAAPFSFEHQPLTMAHLIDISDQKRRRVLERIFFHDILNTAGSLLNLSQLMASTPGDGKDQRATLMQMASRQLIDEIKAQRELMEAENGELDVHFTDIHAQDSLTQAMNLFKEYQQIHRVGLRLSQQSDDIDHRSDHTLLLRVLSNLIKNALEASRAGESVTVGCRQSEDAVVYWVCNPGFIPLDVQMQIFQRSFSTKGAGRGLGTYSIRLLTEKFLKGTVSFESSAENGTCFKVEYPLRFEI